MATQQIVKFQGKHKLEELFQQKEQLADMKVVLLTDAETTECFGQKETIEKLLQTFILQYEHEGKKSIVLRDTNGMHLGLAWKEPGKWEYKLLDHHEQTVLEKIMSHSGMVIDSPNNSENKDFDSNGKKPAWLYQQSAVIPYIKHSGVTQVVLITSSSGKNWVIPKGVIERFMSPEESAAKEALEEAGVIGHVSSSLVTEYKYKKWGATCHVKVYPLKVSELLEVWDEMEKRERISVDITTAIELVKPELKEVLKVFKVKNVVVDS